MTIYSFVGYFWQAQMIVLMDQSERIQLIGLTLQGESTSIHSTGKEKVEGSERDKFDLI